MKRLVVAILTLLQVGCSSQYVVRRDVPESPTFSVLPGTVSKSNMDFANTVTGLLISCGVKVVERPAMLSSYTESRSSGSVSAVGLDLSGGLAAVGGTGGGKGEATAQNIDVVELYDQTRADYVIVAFQNSSHLRIVRRDTKEVLFAGSIRTSERDRPEKAMRKLLEALGIRLPS